MVIWHLTPNAPRFPFFVSAGQNVNLQVGTWPIAPMYYRSRDRWIDVMRHTIAFNASFFNTHRMVQQYAANAYL
jgi:hypothetical protein